MCYNISNPTKEEKTLEKRLGAKYPKKLGQIKANYTVSGFTHPQLPIITSQSPDEFQLSHWGLVPNWTKTAEFAKQYASNNLNSKSETIFEKPSFKTAIFNQRCIIPVSGFFEWREVNKKKYPYYIHLKNEEIFCFAGIYDEWVNTESGEIINSFSIITTEANSLLEKIHNIKKRMPLILPTSLEKKWIEPSLSKETMQELFKPLDVELMNAYTISKRITSRLDNPNVPETLLPFEYPELAFYDL